MVVISASGKLSLMRRQTLKTRPMYAFQAGPFLIRGSWLYRRQTQKAERRTVLAMTKRGDVLVLSASDVTLTTLAKILKTTGDALSDSAITVALNLDGGSSTAMTLRVPKKRSIVVPEVFPVRSALLFFSKV
mgnify:CR=1 FL=1